MMLLNFLPEKIRSLFRGQIERARPLFKVMGDIDSLARGQDPEAYLLDLYVEGTDLFAIFGSGGRLKKGSVTLGDTVTLSDLVEVEQRFDEVAAQDTQERARKDRSVMYQIIREGGKTRWIGVSSVAVLNREGEIDSRRLFDSMIAFAERTKQYPIRVIAHLGETFRVGQVDMMTRIGNCLVTSGVYDDSQLAKAEIAARQADPSKWGDSISFAHVGEPETLEGEMEGGESVLVLKAGICREISTCLEERAASHMTGLSIIKKERTMAKLTDDQKKTLLELFQNDETKMNSWMEDFVDEAEREIKNKKMITRTTATTEATEAPPEDEDEDEDDDDGAEIIMDDQTLDLIVGKVVAAMQPAMTLEAQRTTAIETAVQAVSENLTKFMEASTGHIERMTARLENLSVDEDEKKRTWQSDIPRKSRIQVTHRPRTLQTEGTQPSMNDIAAQTLAKMNGK